MSEAPKASWWQRAGAALIDGLVLLAAAVAVGLLVGLAGAGSTGITIAVYAVVVVASLTYGPLLMAREGDANGQTIGKAALGIRVVHDDGHPMTLSRGLLREAVGKGALGLVPFYSFVDVLWPLGDKRRQALHDKVGTTYVVDAEQVPVVTRHELGGFAAPDPHASWSAPSQPAGAPAPPPVPSAWAPPTAPGAEPEPARWTTPDGGDDRRRTADDEAPAPPEDEAPQAEPVNVPPHPPAQDLGGFAPPAPPPPPPLDEGDGPSGPFGPSYD